MPTIAIGALYNVYVPNVTDLLALGYTVIRVYWASSENGSYSLVTSISLVDGTYSYEYNHTTGAAGDWAKHTFYGATPGESPTSEPVPVAPTQSTRALIRQGVGRRLRLMEGPFSITTATDGDTLVLGDLVDADGAAERYSNWFGRSTTQVRQIRNVAGSGYVAASGTLNFRRAFNPTLSSSDPLELWKARGNEDPSVMVDEAMNRSRMNIWWEETLYLTAGSDQTEYYLPGGIIVSKRQVKRVEWAASQATFPNRPIWQPCERDVTFDGGQPLLSVTYGGSVLSQGSLIRVIVNRFGDRMDSESDYWAAPLEWCIAETALAVLDALGSPTGTKEDVRDFEMAQRRVVGECVNFRSLYQPEIEISMEPPL